jgi:hypothetical protein
MLTPGKLALHQSYDWVPGNNSLCLLVADGSELQVKRNRIDQRLLQGQQPLRPKLNWADRALLATLLRVIPKARCHGLRLLVTPDMIVRWYRDIVRRRWAARSTRGKTGRPAARRNIRVLVLRLARENPDGDTAGSTEN